MKANELIGLWVEAVLSTIIGGVAFAFATIAVDHAIPAMAHYAMSSSLSIAGGILGLLVARAIE